MDAKRVLLLLDTLHANTSGHADEIAGIYQRALDEDDDILRLKSLLNDCMFYREIGGALNQRGEEALKEIYSSPSKAFDTLPRLMQTYESIAHEVRLSERLMRSPTPFSETVLVLRKKDIASYMAALRTIAGTCLYLIALYAGLDKVKNLSWDDTVGIQELIYAINTKFLPALCAVRCPDYSWVIRKRRMGGSALFDGDCFYLSYESAREVDMHCGALYKEPLGTHAFLNANAYESGETDTPFCWGTGNIVSFLPDNAILLLQNKVVTKVRAPRREELMKKMPTPFECIRQLSDGAMFCVSPDELLLAMNQWQMGYEIEMRKRMHICLFCGKHVSDNRLVCPSHFTSKIT